MAINFPNSPSNGATHTAAGQTFTYDGTAGVWNPQEGTPVSTGTSAPSSPTAGDLWFDTSSGTLYFYYADGSSNQWVGVSGPAGATGATGATGAAGPTGSINILTDVDTTTAAPSTGDLLQWNGTNWVPYTHTNGIIEVDQWRLTVDVTTTGNNDITANLERVDDASFSKIGTGMSHSNGVFTFPSTGLYEVITVATFNGRGADDGYMALRTFVSTDGGANYDVTSDAISLYTGKFGRMTVGPGIQYVNVTNTTNVVVKFTCNSLVPNNYLEGHTDHNRTYFTFKRLGDSQ